MSGSKAASGTPAKIKSGGGLRGLLPAFLYRFRRLERARNDGSATIGDLFIDRSHLKTLNES